MPKIKILPLAVRTRRYDLAAHAIVYGMLKATIQENQRNGKKRSTAPQSERP